MKMLRALHAIGVALLALPAVAMAQGQPLVQVNKSIDAIGRNGLEQLRTIAVKGRGQFWEPDESYVAGGPAVHVADVTYEIRRDLSQDTANISWVRDYLELPWPRMNKYIEIVSEGLGFAIGNDGGPRTASLQAQGPERVMSGNRLAATTRELKRTSPVLLLEMANRPEAIGAHPDVFIDGQPHPAVSYRTELAIYLVIFDPLTSLPARIRTMDFDPLHGDSAFDWVISDWRPTQGGAKYPFRQRYEIASLKLMDFEIQEVNVNPSLDPGLFKVPDAIRVNAPKIATSNVPYLWILRRQLIGSYYDVQNLTHDPARVTLEFIERAPGVWQAQGTIHHTLIVEMDQYLVVFDAPYMDGYSKWVIEQVKAKFSNKPIKYLVLTHHHIDHVAGYRSFVAQGASLVVGRGTKEFWRKALASQDSLGADTPKKKLADAEIIEVSDRYTIIDGSRRLELYELPNQHSDGMLVAYIPHAKLGFQTDIWTGPGVDPMGAQAMPRQRALVELIEKLKLEVTHFIGGHGRIGAYAGLRRTLDGTVPVEESFYLVNNTQEKVDFNISQNGSYWIPFVLEPGRDAKITNGQVWPSAAKETVMFVNIITGQLRTGDRVEATEKVEQGKRYEITSDAQCKCRKLKPL
jgi:glyoxylase-like metal-dependent hydrolase (beta-lactamase superfamily II)